MRNKQKAACDIQAAVETVAIARTLGRLSKARQLHGCEETIRLLHLDVATLCLNACESSTAASCCCEFTWTKGILKGPLQRLMRYVCYREAKTLLLEMPDGFRWDNDGSPFFKDAMWHTTGLSPPYGRKANGVMYHIKVAERLKS